MIYIDNYDEVGSGPGYSLLCCKDELQVPFIFTSVDTIVKEDIIIGGIAHFSNYFNQNLSMRDHNC